MRSQVEINERIMSTRSGALDISIQQYQQGMVKRRQSACFVRGIACMQ